MHVVQWAPQNRMGDHLDGQPSGVLVCMRSIPARAGEPTRRWPTKSNGGVYPRACGGTFNGGQCVGCPVGLSPRVRGNHGHGHTPQSHPRSIPARAGEPRMAFRLPPDKAVYPRACGGTAGVMLVLGADEGLSPRVRGNRFAPGSLAVQVRSIPARAGEPARRWPTCSSSPVYPRACGGTGEALGQPLVDAGLSPRVRGNRQRSWGGLHAVRSIPARAGEPRLTWPSPMLPTVYPRACGGTDLAIDETKKTKISTVYPRACGGTVLINETFPCCEGLSPRVRGNLAVPFSWRPCPGSIPARAGEPYKVYRA